MVYGRTRKIPGKKKSRPAPPDQWIWSPQPAHEALTDRATWDAAQRIGAERGNVRDAEKPTTQPGSRYPLRSRMRHEACQRRMYGVRRPTVSKVSPGAVYTYYHCPYNPSNPRHVAAWPGHPGHSVSIREEAIMAAIAGFLGQYLFGHDRAAMLAAQIPATDAEHAAARDRQHDRLTADLARIATAQEGLFTELERLGADTSPATQAYRQRIQTRHAELHDEHTSTQAQLDDLAGRRHPQPAPRPPRRTALPHRPARRRPRRPARSPHQRPRHPDPLPARTRPGHHLGHPHRHHPRHHHRPTQRPPRQRRPEQHPGTRPAQHTRPHFRVGARPYSGHFWP